MKLSDRDLLAIIKGHRAASLGVEDGQLTTERAKAMDHYHGRPYGNEVEGRSQVVSRDLAEAVDWAMPGIMRVFLQSGTIAEFDPVGPEDEKLAQQESDYVNQVLMKENHGFMVLHDAIKDTLLLKNGYVKHWWDEEEKIEETTYTGITLDQLAMMWADFEKAGASVEVVAQTGRMVEIPGMPPANQAMGIMVPPMIEVFDVRLKITRKVGKLVWMAVPTEEVRVSKKCRGSLQDSPFTEHVTRKTRSDLIEMGMSRDFVDSLPAFNETDNDSQVLARDSTDDESEGDVPVGDKSMDEIEYCEAYLRVDYDGDGVAELRKVVTAGDKIPPGDAWNEPIPAVPMTGFVAKRVPHRHVGESLDDELADIQEIMTVLKRQILDNIYLNNNSEIVVNTDYVKLSDFMTRTPGGVKRMKGNLAPSGAVMPLVTKPIINEILPVVDHFERAKQQRSGIAGPNTGVDPDVLQQTTKGAFLENLSRASQKMEMISRMLAETGVKEALLQCHGILIRHQQIAKQVQLRGKWTPVNPQEWKTRSDLTVKVGLGTGSEEEKRQKLGMLVGLQGQLLGLLAQAPPIVYAKAYALFEDMAKTLGAEMPEKYAVSPGSQEHQKLMQERQQALAKGDPKAQAEFAKIQQQGQLENQRMNMQAKVDQNRQEMEAQQQAAKMQGEMQFKRFEAMLDMQADKQRAQMELQFQKWKAELDAAVRIQTANIASKSKLNDPATMAATAEISAEVTQDGHVMPDGSMMQGPPMGGMMGNAPAEGEGFVG